MRPRVETTAALTTIVLDPRVCRTLGPFPPKGTYVSPEHWGRQVISADDLLGSVGMRGLTPRLLHATTDRRILCTHYPFNFGSVAAVDSKLFRSADGFRFAGSPTGEEGGSEKPWKQRLRLKSALGEEALNLHCAKKCRGRDVRVRVEVRRAPWRRRIRAGGGPRTRWCERVGTARRRQSAQLARLVWRRR